MRPAGALGSPILPRHFLRELPITDSMNVSSQRTTSAVPARPLAARPAAAPTQGQSVGSKDAVPAAPGGPDRTAQLARFDGFADALRERVSLAQSSMSGGDASLLREAREWLEHGLDRLRRGFAEGSLNPADMERGVGSLFAGAARLMADRERPTDSKSLDVAVENAVPAKDGKDAGSRVASVEGVGSPEAASDDESVDTAAAMRERMGSLVDHVLRRADAAGYPDAQREAAAAEAAALFEQAAGRLDAAVFEPGEGAPLNRTELARFFQSSFSALRGEILALLDDGPGATGNPATTYGPGAGAEAMSTPRGQVDFQG